MEAQFAPGRLQSLSTSLSEAAASAGVTFKADSRPGHLRSSSVRPLAAQRAGPGCVGLLMHSAMHILVHTSSPARAQQMSVRGASKGRRSSRSLAWRCR